MNTGVVAMKPIHIALFAIVFLCSVSRAGHAATASVKDSNKTVSLQWKDQTPLLHVEQTADVWGWTIKMIGQDERRMVGICREAICIPVALKSAKHGVFKDALYLDAKLLGRAMGFDVNVEGKKVTLSRSQPTQKTQRIDVPAYHDDWGKQRGFRKGQTLPDIPLIDLDGNEVRFGRFLGKQYIIYGWASW